MKHADSIMREVWRAKEANAARHKSLSAYVEYLCKLADLRNAATPRVGTVRRSHTSKKKDSAGG